MTKSIIATLVCAFLIAGCTEAAPKTGTHPAVSRGFGGAMTFEYQTFNAAGAVQTQGHLLIPWPLDAGQQFTGTWDAQYMLPIKREATPEEIDAAKASVGPQVGRGRMQGRVNGNQLVLELNPGMADNNITLQSEVKHASNELAGTWSWSTFAGVKAQGNFKAKAAQ